MAEYEDRQDWETELAKLNDDIDAAKWAVDRAAAKLDASANDRPDWQSHVAWYNIVHAKHAGLVAKRDQLLRQASGE